MHHPETARCPLCSLFQVLLVLFAQQHSDLVELGSLCRLFGPAALHQLTQLGAVTLWVNGRPQAGPLPQNHAVHDLCTETVEHIQRRFRTSSEP